MTPYRRNVSIEGVNYSLSSRVQPFLCRILCHEIHFNVHWQRTKEIKKKRHNPLQLKGKKLTLRKQTSPFSRPRGSLYSLWSFISASSSTILFSKASLSLVDCKINVSYLFWILLSLLHLGQSESWSISGAGLLEGIFEVGNSNWICFSIYSC